MITTRRLAAVAMATFTACCGASAVAQAPFPNKPIKLIIGFPAGGPLDQHARLLSDRLQKELGQPVVIDYKTGAGGVVGAQEVMKSPADGYTLMLANTGVMVLNPTLYTKLPYSTLKDFVPIARTARQPLALLVHPSVPAKTLPEFVSLVKKSPGKFNYGSAGNGGISHIVPEMLKTASGMFLTHIPYRGSAPAFQDLIAGQVQFMAESIPQAAQYHKQGRVRALAVTSKERNSALPDVPTAMESGFKDFDVVGFYGYLAPAGTPKPVVERLSKAFEAVLKDPDIASRMTAQGADPAYLGADAFAEYLKVQSPKWAEAVKRSGAKLD